jgi:O-antigen/teichoic acid export membrane protein
MRGLGWPGLDLRSGRYELPFFMLSSGLFQASRLGINLVAAAVLAPTLFGIWNIVVVLQTYTTHGSLGLLSGANRRVPLLLGSGAPEEARLAERTSLGGSLVAGALLAIAAAGIGLLAGGPWRAAGLLIGFGVWAQQLYLCGQVVLRGNLQFDRASAQQLALAAVFPVVGLPGVLVAGINGLIAAQAVAYAVGFVLVLRWRPDLRPALDRRLAFSLIREGAPIMLSGLAFAIMTSVDRWALVTTGRNHELGQYALASTISASMMFVNLVVAQQLYPKMAHAYGMHGRIDAIRGLARRQGLIAGGLVFLMAIVLIVVAPLVVPRLLPAYASSVGAMQVLAMAYTILALASGFTNLLVTIGRAWLLLILQVATGALGGLLGILALRAGLGLTGLAAAMLVSFAVLGLTAAWSARSSHGPPTVPPDPMPELESAP